MTDAAPYPPAVPASAQGGYEYDDQDVEDYAGHHGHAQQPQDAVKLFVGQVPRTMDEDELRPILENFGPLYDIVIIRDKISGAHRGCAFVTYCTRDAAEAAIDTLHNQVTLPMSPNPLQVRPAEGQAGEHKLFIGMIPKHADEADIRGVFDVHGEIEEIYILRHPGTGQSKGCAFLKFKDRHAASAAIDTINGAITMDRGTAPLVVKFADSRRQRIQRARNQAATSAAAYWQMPPGAAIPFPQLQQIQQQYMQQMQAFGAQAVALDGARASAQVEGPVGANLFIYHLPHDLTDADLATAFAPFGTVISAKVYMDKNTGESKGFGTSRFVSYDSAQAADAAIASMNGFQIGSKRLKVQHKRVHHRGLGDDYLDHMDSAGGSDELGLEHSVQALHLDNP
ncbi:hypothetical protein B5M09_007243 [Aphanomyces astaci]|uniref:RRM domain-containing protein n=1 Tax=Aphanomyces astaci TaxID=112090 RepID=A0A3R7WNP8_APHAT|nr:hypothetical protein B5M09_007243 [Aphanomyces astaci]